MVVAPKIDAGAAAESAGLGEVSFASTVGEDDGAEEVVKIVAPPAGFAGADGEEKNEVMDAFAFGFLAVLAAISAALRFSGVAMTLVWIGGVG